MSIFNGVLNMSLFEFLQFSLFIGSAFFAAMVLAMAIIQKSITTPFPIIVRHKEEKHFLDPDSDELVDFPSIEDEPTIDLSVIVPAYNEEERLPKMLDECMDFLEEKAKKCSFAYEVIVVSDGSNDQTVKVGLEYSQKYTSNKLRVLELVQNRGKGGAVRLGMLSARGKYLLFADADGATKFSDYKKLENQMLILVSDFQSDGITIGSRAHLEEDAAAERSIFRTVLMHGFHFLVWLFAVKKIRDTQCGFKLLTRSAARKIFRIMHVERWAFDVELLYIAQHLNMPIKEIAVNWKEIEGSKIVPFWSWLQMGTDLFLIWFRYTVGAWKIEKEHM